METKKIIEKKTYLIELIHYDNGTYDISRTNNGFKTLDLLGIIEHSKYEIYQIMLGQIKPTIVKRKVIEKINKN